MDRKFRISFAGWKHGLLLISCFCMYYSEEDINNTTAQCAGVNSILPKEHCGKIFNLPVRPRNEPQDHGEVKLHVCDHELK